MRVVLADFDAPGLRAAEQEVQALGAETLAVTMEPLQSLSPRKAFLRGLTLCWDSVVIATAPVILM